MGERTRTSPSAALEDVDIDGGEGDSGMSMSFNITSTSIPTWNSLSRASCRFIDLAVLELDGFDANAKQHDFNAPQTPFLLPLTIIPKYAYATCNLLDSLYGASKPAGPLPSDRPKLKIERSLQSDGGTGRLDSKRQTGPGASTPFADGRFPLPSAKM
ncbi:hypothetical protein BDP27DRAFT_1421066 [Rhodocollybia butyracea]|uniref:Uncharacterized protein n=1 Tax=Rhodocollybia butyracea TaxID=206335 RepID=A0A9P5PTT6_9AGAR|nr:hypothetical protein BDP27DRAFT_1421066 [Rhodocollybia butyracea]